MGVHRKVRATMGPAGRNVELVKKILLRKNLDKLSQGFSEMDNPSRASATKSISYGSALNSPLISTTTGKPSISSGILPWTVSSRK